MDVAELALETFSPILGSALRMRLPPPYDLVLELQEARALAPASSPPRAFRVPFRLLFHGPASPVQPQSTVPLEHPELGRIEIFVVPIGPDSATGAMRYEAIFT
jgi:hypothetical protein